MLCWFHSSMHLWRSRRAHRAGCSGDCGADYLRRPRPLTGGIRHAVRVARDFPLYVINDGQLLALLACVGNALKGPLPPSLLTPIPTPVGDLGPAVLYDLGSGRRAPDFALNPSE